MYDYELINDLNRIWSTYCPELRFCQFILNEMAAYEKEHKIEDCFYVSDKEFKAFINNRYGGAK